MKAVKKVQVTKNVGIQFGFQNKYKVCLVV
jgi:hypothetical protein